MRNPNRLNTGKFGTGKKIQIKCSICNKKMIRTPAFVKAKKFYCSYECQRNRGASIVRNCFGCESKIKTSQSLNQRYCSNKCYSLSGRRGEIHQGERNNNWRGGITPINMQIRSDFKYKTWRELCLKRDNYTCVLCDIRGSGNLNVDHYPKPFALIIFENDIRSIEEALTCDALWDTNNGRTLCENCHTKTNTYKKRLGQLKEAKQWHINPSFGRVATS